LSPRLLFCFNAPPTTEIYTLSLHDALPISFGSVMTQKFEFVGTVQLWPNGARGNPVALYLEKLENSECRISARLSEWRHVVGVGDRKSTRLNSSHQIISYAVFCLKKKKKHT